MSKRSKKGNQLAIGTLALIIFVGAIVVFSDQTELFRGQFFFNTDAPETQQAAEQINTDLPESPARITVSKSENSPAQIDKNSSLISVFEISPFPEYEEKISPSRLVLNIASETATTSDIEAKVFFAHKPNCTEIEKSFCDFPPEPEAVFTTTKTVANPLEPKDIIIELESENRWEIDPQDWRFEEYGNTFYLAIYGTVETPADTQNNTMVTGVNYLGNPGAPFGISGLPTDYQITNVY